MVESDYPHHEALEPLPEGVEAPPPWVKGMAVIRWIILGGMTLFAVIMILGYFGVGPTNDSQAAPVQYHCPMHPTYVSSQPGECPICGMTLVPMASDSTDSASTVSAPVDSASGARDHDVSKMHYVCPMHPEVVSDTPGTCPKCHMTLVAVPDTAAMGNPSHEEHTMGESTVPGLVPVTIEPERLQLIGVKTAPVQQRALGSQLRLSGFVTPDETRLSHIHVRFSGWVKQLEVNQTGERVDSNEQLLSVYSQEVDQAEQDYLLATDPDRRTGDDVELSDARRQLAAAATQRLQFLGVPEAEILRLAASRKATGEIWIYSPYSGNVLEKSVVPGVYITPDQTLFTIVDLSKVWVVAEVYEHDRGQIAAGDKVQITGSSLAGATLPGTIGFLYPEITASTRTLKVRMEVDNPKMRLLPGQYVDVNLQGDSGSVLAVPADAVMDGGLEQYAFVVHGGKHFEPRLVTVGQRSDDWVEVLSGLSLGDTVVTSANFLIDSESRMKAALLGRAAGVGNAHSGHGP